MAPSISAESSEACYQACLNQIILFCPEETYSDAVEYCAQVMRDYQELRAWDFQGTYQTPAWCRGRGTNFSKTDDRCNGPRLGDPTLMWVVRVPLEHQPSLGAQPVHEQGLLEMMWEDYQNTPDSFQDEVEGLVLMPVLAGGALFLLAAPEIVGPGAVAMSIEPAVVTEEILRHAALFFGFVSFSAVEPTQSQN